MIADAKKAAEQKMKKTLETLRTDLGKVRTGRAHTGILDHIVVDYYGTPTPISQVGNVTLIDARTISPWLIGFSPRSEPRMAFSMAGVIFLSHGVTAMVLASISVTLPTCEMGVGVP